MNLWLKLKYLNIFQMCRCTLIIAWVYLVGLVERMLKIIFKILCNTENVCYKLINYNFIYERWLIICVRIFSKLSIVKINLRSAIFKTKIIKYIIIYWATISIQYKLWCYKRGAVVLEHPMVNFMVLLFWSCPWRRLKR